MAWDWAIDTFKTLIGAAIIYVANWLREKFKPTLKHLKRINEVSDRVDVMESDLLVMKSRQMALIDVDHRPIFIMNSKNEVVKVNSAWLEMTGMKTEKEALGFGYLQAIPEEDREMIQERSDFFLEHPSPYSGEVRFKNVHTKEIIIAYCRSEFFNKDQKLYETIGMLHIKN